INGRFIQTTPKYLTDILRGQLGFDGFVVADWGVVTRALRFGQAETEADCAATAINAGLDMDMVVQGYVKHLEKAVENGDVAVETIDLAVRRVLRIKFAKGLFENPYSVRRPVDFTAHLANARRLAADSMVLLKNDGVLPLSKDQKVLLSGPFVRERRALLGSWTLNGLTEETPHLLEAMQEVLSKNVVYNESDFAVYDSTLMQADSADVIVLALGESNAVTGENRCVADISLDSAQVELVKKAKQSGKKVVGVFFCGRPLALEGVTDLLDAVLYAWHGGSETARATCDVLFGDVVPGGKLPMTMPRKTGQIPLYYNVVATGMNYYGEGYNQCYVDSKGDPLYPFGYGLSYTTFTYDTPTVSADTLSLQELKGGKMFTVSADVTNTGDIDAKETVQLYIRDKAASLLRPMRELKGFEKTLITAGETKTVTFTVGEQQLGFYLEDGTYTVEKGEFEIYVGGDSLTTNKISVWVK
ncbi:MAG: glycoside hydrolase family 3 C-terminal domain-containing protein, partial [Clostridia bacterium]|nr:glycoside hydrolase family 3 C-terminal domain-containing protein [Clostridia bacterium]